jgi:competence protein ComGD
VNNHFSFLRNERGFTLTEMTIVLFIVAIVSSLSIGNMKKAYDATKRNEIIYQLEQDLYYAQQKAISHNLMTNVVFLNGSKEYVIRQGGEVILGRKFHQQNVTFLPVTLALNDITFLNDGNARKSGTLQIKIDSITYRLVLLLGRGRFYIEKL